MFVDSSSTSFISFAAALTIFTFFSPQVTLLIIKSVNVGEYYGPNFSCTESTSYPEKEKARIKFMNFSQKFLGSVFLGHPVLFRL